VAVEQLELLQLKEPMETLLLFSLKHQQVVEVVDQRLLVTLEDLEDQVVELVLEEELQDLEEQVIHLQKVPLKEIVVETVQEHLVLFRLPQEAVEVVVEFWAQDLTEQHLE
jgi:hypothetical protein